MAARQQCDSSDGQAPAQPQRAGRVCRGGEARAGRGLGLRNAARRGRLAALRRCYHDNTTIRLDAMTNVETWRADLCIYYTN